jgi:hypothetical protein
VLHLDCLKGHFGFLYVRRPALQSEIDIVGRVLYVLPHARLIGVLIGIRVFGLMRNMIETIPSRLSARGLGYSYWKD